MRITQGTFSYLRDLEPAEIRAQVQYAIDQGWAVAVEFTDDPHPRNTFWEMYGNPMFDLHDAAGVLMELNNCRAWSRRPSGGCSGPGCSPRRPARS